MAVMNDQHVAPVEITAIERGTGKEYTTTLQQGDRVYKSALAANPCQSGEVTRIQRTTLYGHSGVWVEIRYDNGGTHHYTTADIMRWWRGLDGGDE